MRWNKMRWFGVSLTLSLVGTGALGTLDVFIHSCGVACGLLPCLENQLLPKVTASLSAPATNLA